MITRRSVFGGIGGLSVLGFSQGRVTSRADIKRSAIPTDVVAFTVLGFATPGDKGNGAIYVRGSAEGPLAIEDAEGAWWNLAADSEVWAGWFGMLGTADDTIALQLAIDHVSKRAYGGTVRIAGGIYQIGHKMGGIELNFDENASVKNDVSGVDKQAYCVDLPDNVSLSGERGVTFVGKYNYGDASLNDVICIACNQSELVRNVSISNISFNQYFIAIAAIRATTCVLCKFDCLTFADCAIGFYAHGLERCYFERTVGARTGCLIAVGGRWVTDGPEIREGGGFSDKTDFGCIHNIYDRVLSRSENNIDLYFDKYFFKSFKNSSVRGEIPDVASIVHHPPYLGVCGRVVYLMARHGRPNNANRFGLVSHALAPRAAIWIDAPVACVGELVYLEGCGFGDNRKRQDPIGGSYTDPYLGPGTRVPAFVKGINCPIDAQFVHGYTLNREGTAPTAIYACDLTVKR